MKIVSASVREAGKEGARERDKETGEESEGERFGNACYVTFSHRKGKHKLR